MVKFLQKPIRMCSNKKTIHHFLPSCPPVFSPPVACQIFSRWRGWSAIFSNLTMPAHACASWVLRQAISRPGQDAIGDSIRMRHPGPRTIASGIVRTPVLGLWCFDDREHFRGRVIPQLRPCVMDIRQQTRRRTRQHPGLDIDDVAVHGALAIQIAGIMLVFMARETMHHRIPISTAFLPRQACPVRGRAQDPHATRPVPVGDPSKRASPPQAPVSLPLDGLKDVRVGGNQGGLKRSARANAKASAPVLLASRSHGRLMPHGSGEPVAPGRPPPRGGWPSAAGLTWPDR
jgi:hypothetical protein